MNIRGRCQSSSILWRSVRLHDQRVAKREQMSPSNLQAAIQEEQNRLYRFLHDRMSPKIMEMAFLVENLAADLETAQLEVAAKEVEKIRRLLSDVFDEMHLLFAAPYSPQNPKGVGEETPGPVGAEP
jgi:signal transduction histidine kinase